MKKPLQYEINDKGCFIVTSHAVGSNGYPNLHYQGKQHNAHRAVWLREKGPIPPGFVVRHKCDERRCVNLDHLELGTDADNVNDMVERKRHNFYGHRSESGYRCRGEGSPNAKLTEDVVRRIRASDKSEQQLAREFSIDRNTVGDIRRRRTWKHVA